MRIAIGGCASSAAQQCELVQAKYGVVLVDVDDVVGRYPAAQDWKAEHAEGGEPVPDGMIAEALQARLSQQDCLDRGWLLHGWPHSPAQAEALSAIGAFPDYVIVVTGGEGAGTPTITPDITPRGSLQPDEHTGAQQQAIQHYHHHQQQQQQQQQGQEHPLLQHPWRDVLSHASLKGLLRPESKRHTSIAKKISAAFSKTPKCSSSGFGSCGLEACCPPHTVSRIMAPSGARSAKHVFTDICAVLDAPPPKTSKAAAEHGCATPHASSVAPTPAPHPMVAALSVATFFATNQALKHLFATIKFRFPGSLGGMLLLFALLCAAPPRVSHALQAATTPGATLLTLWLPVFFVPNLVTLPLSPPAPLVDIARITAILVLGLLWNLAAISAATAAAHHAEVALRRHMCLRHRRRNSDVPAPLPFTNVSTGSSGTTGTASGGGDHPHVEPLPWAPRLTWRLAGWLLGASAGWGILAAIVAAAAPVSAAQHLSTLSMVCATLAAYIAGTKVPPKIKTALHPVITTMALAWGAAALQGLALRYGYNGALRAYSTGSQSLLAVGAGDMLSSMLGPSIIGFAVQMHARRRHMALNVGAVFGGTAFAAAFGLFFTALAARVVGLPPEVRLDVAPRAITAPLARVISGLLGSDVNLTVVCVVVTGVLGANFGQRILDWYKVKDPVVRGIAMGGSAHGLGAAATASEPEVFPFAAISMALTATMGTVMMTLPPLRSGLVAVAGA